MNGTYEGGRPKDVMRDVRLVRAVCHKSEEKGKALAMLALHTSQNCNYQLAGRLLAEAELAEEQTSELQCLRLALADAEAQPGVASRLWHAAQSCLLGGISSEQEKKEAASVALRLASWLDANDGRAEPLISNLQALPQPEGISPTSQDHGGIDTARGGLLAAAVRADPLNSQAWRVLAAFLYACIGGSLPTLNAADNALPEGVRERDFPEVLRQEALHALCVNLELGGAHAGSAHTVASLLKVLKLAALMVGTGGSAAVEDAMARIPAELWGQIVPQLFSYLAHQEARC